ncbi:MAG: undecaprenyldiphospho-muramoylpentapeptide beta-N-acetylglucosaminyltransferase [Wolinella sp.]
MNILITGGGTGGHLAIAKAVAEALHKRGHTLYFIGSTRGQDRAWFEHEPLFKERYFLATQGVVNQRGIGLIKSAASMFKAFLEARALLKQLKIERVFSVGGYSAAPAALAGLSLGIALFIHEQNARIGTLNRLLKPFCTRFFSSYITNLGKDSRVDYPVRDCFFNHARVRGEVKNVLFLGGSQGASAINNYALKLAPILKDKGINIAHQCGEREYERLKDSYKSLGIEVALFAFDEKLHERMQWADLAVSRAGASTLWELCANGLPALFIPYPYAASDHQYHNARFILEQDLGFLVREGELSEESLLKILNQNLQKKSQKLREIIKKGASERIALYIELTSSSVESRE